jgi:uncharacterized repeat protein (TIGR01451 family)
LIICYGKKLVGKVGPSLKAWQGIMHCTSNKQPAMSGIDLPGYFTRLMAQARILFLLMTMAFWLACAGTSYGAIIINAPMTDTNSSGWTLGGNPTSSLLTGDGTIDPVGSGWLRLTNNTGNQTGFAYNNTSFDLSQGLLIQFDYATWGGSGADGYSVYLFDAGVSTFNIGAFGGSLGYAQKTGIAGMSGGYVGIGVDEFGNFSNPTEGRYLGPGAYPNTVTVRGTVVGFGGGAIGQTTSTTSYPWIATSANSGSLWYNGTPRPSQTSTDYRKVIIEISPAPNPVVNVWIQFGYNLPFTQMITNQALPAISTSQLLKIGYAASTGGSTNYHEIRNLLVTSQGASTSIDLGIAKSVLDTTTSSTTTTAVGHGIRYTVTARNYGPNNITATGVGIVDNIPSSITGVTWTCAATGGATCVVASGSGNAINTTANLPFGGAVTYTINGTVSAPAPSQLVNTASLVIPGSVSDYNPYNDSITTSIPVASNLSTSTKTVVDTTTAGVYAKGDVLQYTITLKESSGAAASGVSVTDAIDANLTNFTVVSFPAGATNSSTGTALNITGISVPASGSVTIVYNATISGSATPGTTINNTATITNPNGVGATPVAPVVTVTGYPSVTGTKLLYLYDGTSTPGWKLSRTPNTTSANYATINSSSRIWAMNPAAAAAITISPTVSATVPVTLYLSRDATAGNRSVTVNLQCSSGGTVLTQTLTLTTLTTTPIATTFNLPLAANLTCGQGYTWNLTVSTSTALNTRVSPQSGGTPSHVDLPATTVISVNSIGFYNATYPGGSAITTVAPGTTVYIQAVVSDPFGSYDIVNAPTITISNPSGTVIVNAAAMTLVATGTETPSLTKIYQYAYTVPASPLGNWSVSVKAAEGTEGTVTNTAYATMAVALPNLSIVKYADKASAAPGDIITYTETITNTGAGIAPSVVVTDSLSPYVQWGLNSYGAGVAFQFVQGAPASALTLGTPVYSNNNGATWVYTPVSGGGGAPAGYDGNVTNWSIPMSGMMNANGANFTINYKVRVK